MPFGERAIIDRGLYLSHGPRPPAGELWPEVHGQQLQTSTGFFEDCHGLIFSSHFLGSDTGPAETVKLWPAEPSGRGLAAPFGGSAFFGDGTVSACELLRDLGRQAERVAGGVEQDAPAVRCWLFLCPGCAKADRLCFGLVEVVDGEIEVHLFG